MNPKPKPLPRQMSEDLDASAPANVIVRKFGGTQRMHRLTGFAVSTIYSWQKNGLVPAKWRFDGETGDTESYARYLLRIAANHNIALTASDFIEGANGQAQ